MTEVETDPVACAPTEPRGDFCESLAASDPSLATLLADEERRNLATVNLIASESYCPRSTLEVEASLLANKNVYGYPGSRGVAGCDTFDKIEILAQKRACALFQAEHANVQALSSTIANIAVLRALAPPGGVILSFEESAGGHHSHGASYHLVGRDFQVHGFGADESARSVDFDAARRLAREVRPAVIVAGSTSFPYAIDFTPLSEIAADTDALLFADIAHVSGFVAAGLLPSPSPVADVVTTSTHKTLCGPRTGGLILCKSRFAQAIDEELFPGIQGAPGAHIIAARATLFSIAASADFRRLMQAVRANAHALAVALLACGVRLYLGGTDTHMVVVDLRDRAADGLRLERLFERHGLLANRIILPALAAGKGQVGMRFGTTAMTIRGVDERGIGDLAEIISQLLALDEDRERTDLSERIGRIAKAFPIPEHFLPMWFHKNS